MTEIINKSKKLASAVKKTEIGNRLFSSKPKFWQNVQIVGAGIALIGTLIATLPISLPTGLVAVGTYLVTAGGTIAAFAQLPTKDKSDEEIKKAIEEGIKKAKK